MNITKLLGQLETVRVDMEASLVELRYLEQMIRGNPSEAKDAGNPRPVLSAEDTEKYELTGEYRVPRDGERWLGATGGRVVSFRTAHVDIRIDDGARWIVHEKPKSPVPTPPPLRPEDAKWFEYTGEYRYPKHNELYLCGTVVDVAEFDFKYVPHHIVRFKYAKEETK